MRETTSNGGRPMALPGRTLFLLTLALGALGVTGCHHEEGHHEEHGAYPATHPLRRDTDLTQEYVANVHSIQHIELRAMEHGYIQEILVDEGKPVTEGELMFRIMPQLYQAELRKARAEADFAQIGFANTKALRDSDVVSANELALAKAELDKANAELSLAETHLGFTAVYAPFDGIMGRLEVRRGSLVDEGELLTTLADNSQMWVYFNVGEAEYLEYKMAARDGEVTPVKLRLANGQVFEQEGHIDTIAADFNNETGNIAFRASFPNPDGLLRHGETGKIIMTTVLPDALLIPQKATFDLLDKKYVFVVHDEGTVELREIRVSEELPNLYVVESGVTESEVILLEGLRKVRDGDEIEFDYEEPAEVYAHLELHAE